jgi:hypothetical protein
MSLLRLYSAGPRRAPDKRQPSDSCLVGRPDAGVPPSIHVSPDLKQILWDDFGPRLQKPVAVRLLGLDLFNLELDIAFTTTDGRTAMPGLALGDISGHLLSTEPGLALAHFENGGCRVLFPGDPGWDETLVGLPEGMLPVELSPMPAYAQSSLAV